MLSNSWRQLARWINALVFGLVAVCCQPAAAFTGLYAFGDSLSDTGNIYIATGGAQPSPGQPYFNGRFSNGPVWVETLAAGLGLASHAAPFLAGGSNYAFGGARTGTSGSPPGVLAQLGGLWAPSHPVADPNALYIVVAGLNDVRDARSGGGAPAVDAAQQNLFSAVTLLAQRGAKHVLIANLADLGATPEAAALGLQAPSTALTLVFNAYLATFEAALEGTFTGLDVDLLDMFGLDAAIRQDALNNGGATYGITNVTSPCAGFTGSAGASCDVSLFSDALHPSARTHAILGAAALDLIAPAQQAPEPGTLALLGLGLAGLAAARRREKSR